MNIFNNKMTNMLINNKSYVGKNIVMKNNKIYVDGKLIEGDADSDDKTINIVINGDVDSVDVSSCDKVEVHGNVEKVNTTSGDISCNNIAGDAKTVSGNIKCQGNINGNAKTVSGNITHSKSLMKD